MITDEQRTAFARDGYIVLRACVPAERVRAARDRIAEALERDESIGELPRFLASTFCPSITRDPEIVGLLEPAYPAIAALFGVPEAPRAKSGQIALRFPERARIDARHGFHLDGFPTALNNVPRGTVHRHTLLCGVYLTPLRGPDRGNFVVWPGSHRHFARMLRALDAPAFLATHGAEALLDRIRAEEVGPPRQIEVEPGDVVLAHHLLAHGASDNLALRTRETVYFRLLHPRDSAQDPTPLMDERAMFDGVDWSTNQD
ncbi:phytanoyl-CoA dioxygenase family protein [Sandaracinus amylolyticus]|uniref:phytanoyl-CoA dioxygenase family protein n=1 Tax=Sandaracinus amylolyticus TaxID=927083 RepID=UPI001F18699B|nr:phytanoyl-CoA dioxygenase family protein [Sandaracinus amylolyticus]UJR81934.1 Hypothetical protein I5071_39990 [Sandaracinus amylolyticus]